MWRTLLRTKTRHMNIPSALPGVAATAVVAATAAMIVTSVSPTTAAPVAPAAADPTVFTFQSSEAGMTSKYIDIGRSGESIGDRYLTGLSVTQDGKIAGRLAIECVAIDRVYGGQTCEIAVQLADGTMFLEGTGYHRRVPNVGKGTRRGLCHHRWLRGVRRRAR